MFHNFGCFLNSLWSTGLQSPIWTHHRIRPGTSPVTRLIWRCPKSIIQIVECDWLTKVTHATKSRATVWEHNCPAAACNVEYLANACWGAELHLLFWLALEKQLPCFSYPWKAFPETCESLTVRCVFCDPGTSDVKATTRRHGRVIIPR